MQPSTAVVAVLQSPSPPTVVLRRAMADAALGDIWTILCDYRQSNKRQRVDDNAAGPDATVRTGVEAGWDGVLGSEVR